MIRFDAVTKSFGGRKAVDDVSFAVEPGTVCALVGTSGSGKSTLLRMVNRLENPDSGRILFDGVDIAGLAPVELRRRIGYVIQSIGLFPHWTVARNIATVPRLLGWERGRVEARVSELLDLVGLEPEIHAQRYPDQLSGGQQQRVGVARALAADPELLLMDEPFGAVDPLTRRSLQESLAAIQKRTGTTVLLVTHDVEEAIRLGGTIAMLEHGRLVQAGAPAAVLAHPASEQVARFFGGPLLGLHLLQVLNVGERTDFSAAPAADGEPIPAGATLEEALARMIADGVAHLPVLDAANGRRGTLNLTDLVGR
ncbi:ABC transporter ATP-binding protein [Ancylobacter sp. MQZ15Z-1]|uniref:ABC transporter ATP-binding protein n=1 Tax=Ancylobacter mangrovi TaxID=2972472 RepID=A0A9X2PGW2_9HYPH|nr:ABC transporter ATP-binding protein [Ancylobacter mangrovi]MCS0496831.1 ABC transporter ATP-binding protein [Ancylobacter mangrovi]